MIKILAIFTSLAFQALGDVEGCPAIKVPEWGNLICTDGTMPGSVCKMSCEEYYDLDGTTAPEIEAMCMDDGTWSKDVGFACSPVRCFPALQTPMNGDLICSAGNLAQSLCVFFCKNHYDMQGIDNDRTSYTICKDDRDGDGIGQWMPVGGNIAAPPAYPPICEPVRCERTFGSPENGKVICSSDNYSGSFCVFYCNEGYRFEGVAEPVLFSSCKNDNDYDNVGLWTRPIAPECEAIGENCGPEPKVDGMVFNCDRKDSVVGTQCVAECSSPTEEIKQNSVIVCEDDLMWRVAGGSDFPKCSTCERVENIQIVAVIHDSENDKKQYGLASRLITRTVTVLQRKYNFSPSVRVNRYSTDIDSSVEVFTTSFSVRKDKAKIDAIPYPGRGADTKAALGYVNKNLNGDDTVLVAMIITNEMLDYDEEADRLAEDLRSRGAMVFAFTIPQKNRAITYYRKDLVKLAGNEEMVYHIGNQRMAEKAKFEVARKIENAALKMGCEKDKMKV